MANTRFGFENMTAPSCRASTMLHKTSRKLWTNSALLNLFLGTHVLLLTTPLIGSNPSFTSGRNNGRQTPSPNKIIIHVSVTHTESQPPSLSLYPLTSSLRALLTSPSSSCSLAASLPAPILSPRSSPLPRAAAPWQPLCPSHPLSALLTSPSSSCSLAASLRAAASGSSCSPSSVFSPSSSCARPCCVPAGAELLKDKRRDERIEIRERMRG